MEPPDEPEVQREHTQQQQSTVIPNAPIVDASRPDATERETLGHPDPEAAQGVLFRVSDGVRKPRADVTLAMVPVQRSRRRLPPVMQRVTTDHTTKKMHALKGGRTPPLLRRHVITRLETHERMERSAAAAFLHLPSRAYNARHYVYELPRPAPPVEVEVCMLSSRLQQPSGRVPAALLKDVAVRRHDVLGDTEATSVLSPTQCVSVPPEGEVCRTVLSVAELVQQGQDKDAAHVKKMKGVDSVGGGGGGGVLAGVAAGAVLPVDAGMGSGGIVKLNQSRYLACLPRVGRKPNTVFELPESVASMEDD